MSISDKRVDPPDLGEYEKNRSKFPLDELAKYAGKHIAFSLDGKRILASGDTEEELDAALDVAGIPYNQIVYSYVDPPDVDCFLG